MTFGLVACCLAFTSVAAVCRAQDGAIRRQEGDDSIRLELRSARVHAAAGDVDAALASLARYLEYEFADSRARLIAAPEFRALHGDARFRALMTDTEELVAARRAARQKRFGDEPTASLPDVSFEQLREAAEVYKGVTDLEAGRRLSQRLYAADQLIGPHVAQHVDQFLELLRAEKKSTYYRLTLARLLAGVGDPELARKAAAEVKDDNFLTFSQPLFFLTYAMVHANPSAAEPLLVQMLDGEGSSIPQPQHARTVDWDGQVFQLFGYAETRYRDLLLRRAAEPEPARSARATRILLAFQEPGLAPILRHKIEAAEPAQHRELVELLGQLVVPEAKKALQGLLDGKTLEGEVAALARMAVEEMLDPRVQHAEITGDGISIDDAALRAIFFSDLELTNGADVSFVEKTIQLSARVSDISKLIALRSSILARFSDEADSDWWTITSVIRGLRWQQ